MNCPCKVSELAALVKVVAIVETENLLLLVSETVPETEVALATVVSESRLVIENWSANELVDGIWKA